MGEKRRVEVFSAGCPLCLETVEMVKSIACSSCEVEVLVMKDPEAERRARALGVRSVPAVAVDGKLASCCAGRGPEEGALREAGVGRPSK